MSEVESTFYCNSTVQPGVPAHAYKPLTKQRKEDLKFKVSLIYTVRPISKNKQNEQTMGRLFYLQWQWQRGHSIKSQQKKWEGF
jgi:hypothetical protein